MTHLDNRIYKLYMQGYSFQAIAKKINKRKLSAKSIARILAKSDMTAEINKGQITVVVPSIMNYIKRLENYDI